MIQTRKVAVTFAKPQNQEQALESNLNAKAEQDIGGSSISLNDVVRYAHEVVVKEENHGRLALCWKGRLHVLATTLGKNLQQPTHIYIYIYIE